MSWATRFRLRQYVSGSLWVLPLAGGVIGTLFGFLDVHIDKTVSLPKDWTYSASTASTLLATIVGAAAALTGFVVTVTVLVVQMATGTFSARYMRLWYRDRVLKLLLALLVGTLAFSFAVMRRVESDFVPNLGTSIAGLLLVMSLLMFMIFLDRFLHRLRPVAVAALVAGYVQRGFERHQAELTAAPDIFWEMEQHDGGEPSLVARSDGAGAIQAIDVRGLLRWARANHRLVVVRHTIGDFVPAGAVLVEAYGGDSGDRQAERKLREMVVLGVERTIEQDPAFAIRIMVDIADKALSAAINDPTTAVQVLNHLGNVLRLIGQIDLVAPRPDEDRTIRKGLVIRTRRWEDYLALGTTEIREYGSGSIQVMRRMRAMLEELHGEVLPRHRAAVEDELARLDATVTRSFGDSIDIDRAGVADAQGIGGRISAGQSPARPPSHAVARPGAPDASR
jgi:uncharacterized membrane protein